MTTTAEALGCPFIDPERIFTDLAGIRASAGFPFSVTYEARIVTRYEDIVTALHDPDTFSSEPAVGDVPSPWKEQFEGRVPPRGTLLGIDNPDHDRLRSSVNTFFVPRRLARFESWIREEAHRLIDTFVADGRTDLKTAFALPLPLAVISHIVGLDASRAEWIGAALGFFMGERDIYHPGTPDEKAQLLLDLHDYIREVMAERKQHRRDDLISHIWNERDSGAVVMTDFEMLSMFPGLMLAGHETSSNLICMFLARLLPEPDQYAAVQTDDGSRAEALEEMFRFESAITGMKRKVMRDTTLGGTALKAGEMLFLAYASGSRDESKFSDSAQLDFSRSWQVPHLGFGQGVHACLGAPLARLLLRIELDVLNERLPALRLAVAAHELRHTVVSEGRGIVSLPVAWDPGLPAEPRIVSSVVRTSVTATAIDVTVTGLRTLGEAVVELTMRPDGSPFPSWEPGAHIDLELPDGAIRQYSICGGDRDTIRIAVLREEAGRGGSRSVHDRVRVGDRLRVRGTRNHFRLRDAPFYLFVAGGIGITPILPMIDAATATATDWRLLYLGRSRDRMPYLDELQRQYGPHVYAWPSAERGRYALDNLWARMPAAPALVYGCGPESLLADLEDSARRHDAVDRLVVERFHPRDVEVEPNRPFEVVLGRSGAVVTVSEDESVLDAVNRAGANVLSTCREGTCGTCEVRVLAGIPEHRDSVLSLEERLENASIMTCLSRCRGQHLVLDL
jgi:cytochrome P450/ferredoxin-NADP reductase